MTLAQLLKHKDVRGVVVGRCVDGSPLDGAWAHAHHDPADKWAGFICVRSPRLILKPGTRQVTALMIHELGHIDSHTGHDRIWRRSLRGLGAPPAAFRP